MVDRYWLACCLTLALYVTFPLAILVLPFFYLASLVLVLLSVILFAAAILLCGVAPSQLKSERKKRHPVWDDAQASKKLGYRPPH